MYYNLFVRNKSFLGVVITNVVQALVKHHCLCDITKGSRVLAAALPQEPSETKQRRNGVFSLLSEFKGRVKTYCCWGNVVEDEFGVKWDL